MLKVKVTVAIFREKMYHHSNAYIYFNYANVGYDSISSKFDFQRSGKGHCGYF